ncbi:MAG: demethoxyubiquinone hydroxylase family protein [Candidatus Pacebacteria bacterium]|nr:demethoxyubiquinone hydroxylase family protein [Candidatus Paceibacterota bacterium]
MENHKPASHRQKNLPLPGDLPRDQAIAQMIRVDHAGEYGAKRIYQGQLAVLERSGASAETLAKIKHMAEQEQGHLDGFNSMMAERRVRPTVLLPLWHVAGFGLGAVTALLGESAAMACTIAVEEVIDQHYADQIAQLDGQEKPLAETLERYRLEELEHRDEAVNSGGRSSPFTDAITGLVRLGSRTAIFLSERV